MPQPHTLLPNCTATRFVAGAPAFARHTRLGLLDPGELVFAGSSGASSRSERRGPATRRPGSRSGDQRRDRRPRCDFYDYGRTTASTYISARIPVRGFVTRRLCSEGIEDQQEIPNV